MTAKFLVRPAVAAMLLYAMPAMAQDFGTVAPKEPTPPVPGGVVTPPPATPAPAQDPNRQLLPELKGLRFVPNIAAVQRQGYDAAGLHFENLPRLDSPDIRAQLSGFVGKPLRAIDLTSISKLVLDYYRAHNLPVVDVAFPEQDINSGVVQAVVTEYKLGAVKVEGNKYFSTGLLRGDVSLSPGDVMDFSVLKQNLNRLNDNPFRSVTAVIERSDQPGDVDLALRTQDRFPLRVYASFDNTGLPITGRDRYSAGFNWGNLFGLDQQISYQFSTSPDLWRNRNRGPGLSSDPRFAAHSFTYSAPLPWGDDVGVFGSAVEQVPDLGPDFGQVGHSLQLGVRYGRDLPAIGTVAEQVHLGFDYKRTDGNLAFGGIQIFSSATNVEQFSLTYGATRPDSAGQTAVQNFLVFSPGGLSDADTTARYQASGVAGAHANYVYDMLTATRLTNLPWDLSWTVTATGQLASTELTPSEQLGAGGLGSVRGYSTRAASGSYGVIASTELRSPVYSLYGDALGALFRDQAQLFVFLDYGHVAYRNTQPQLPKSTELASTGFGIRYDIGRFADIRLDYGWQLEKLPGAPSLGSLALVSLTFGS